MDLDDDLEVVDAHLVEDVVPQDPGIVDHAIDLAKRGMPLPEIAWMRGYLLPLIESGKIDVEEEFQQSCFHISVYRRYVPPADRYNVATREGMTPLPTILR